MGEYKCGAEVAFVLDRTRPRGDKPYQGSAGTLGTFMVHRLHTSLPSMNQVLAKYPNVDSPILLVFTLVHLCTTVEWLIDRRDCFLRQLESKLVWIDIVNSDKAP